MSLCAEEETPQHFREFNIMLSERRSGTAVPQLASFPGISSQITVGQ